jgi:hypothetical protein
MAAIKVAVNACPVLIVVLLMFLILGIQIIRYMPLHS